VNLTARAVRRLVAVTAVAVTAAAGVLVAGALAAAGAAVIPAIALAAPGGTAAGQVPAGFSANSLTWLSPARGWTLGVAPCGTRTCTDVLGTSDGGETWHLTGTVPARLATTAHPGITDVRFATSSVGWAFGPGLLHTTDGGESWAAQPIPGGGKQILSLAASSSGAYAVVSPCAWGTGLCGHQPLSFWRTTPTADGTWTPVALDLPLNLAADVAVYDSTVYVVDGSVTMTRGKLYASTDGRHFSARTPPCVAARDIFLTQAVPTSATDVWFLCDGNPGFSDAVKTVFRSVNTGKTDTYAGTTGPHGIQALLAASPAGNLAVASRSDGSFMYVKNHHDKKWTMVIGAGDGGAGWNDLSYVTGAEAWVVYEPASLPADHGQLYVTRDAGQHWTLVRV
jgi:hypothetical protein